MTTGGINPATSEVFQVEVAAQSDRVVYIHPDPPPPYAPIVTDQPNIQQTPLTIDQPPLTNEPTYYNCPNCRERIVTNVKYVNTRTTHLVAGFICGCTVWCLLCCLGTIPYFVPVCKESKHYCPNCKQCIGSYSKVWT